MKKAIFLLYTFIFSLTSCVDTNRNNKEKITALDTWTDSIFNKYFEGKHTYDTIEKWGNDRQRIKLISKYREEYLLIDHADTLVKTVNIFNPNIKLTKEYCVLNKSPKTYISVQIDGKYFGRVTEKYCFADSAKYEYYENDSLIKTVKVINVQWSALIGQVLIFKFSV